MNPSELPAFSPEWFNRAADVIHTAHLEVPDGQFQFLVIDDGAVVSPLRFDVQSGRSGGWTSECSASDCVIVVDSAVAWSWVFGGATGIEGVRATRVAPDPSQLASAVEAPPADVSSCDLRATMPRILGADVLAQHILTDSPWGTISFVERFENGRRVEWHLGQDFSADVVLTRRFSNSMRRRQGLISNVESFEGGRVQGNWTVVMMLAGLTDDKSYRTCTARSAAACRTLGQLGDLCSLQTFRQLQEDLRSLTMHPHSLGT